MKRMIVALAVLVLACGSASAEHVANLRCLPIATSTSSGAVTKTFHVSFYTIGVTAPLAPGSQTGGVGAGKVTFSTAVFHTSLSNAQDIAAWADAGTTFSTCTLLSTTKSGTKIGFEMHLVAVQSLTAVAGDPEDDNVGKQTAYTEVILQYGALSIMTDAVSDDGGTGSVPSGGGWTRVTSTPVPPTSSGSTPAN